MKRKFLASISLSLVSAMLLSACATKATTENKTSAVKKTEVSVIVSSAYKDYFDNVLIKSCKEKYPEITIKAIYNNEPTVIIQQQLAAGGGPDIITTQGTTAITDFARTSHLVDLDTYSKKYGWDGRFSSWAMDPVSYNGKLYGLPGKVDTEFVYYNKAMFKENGWKIPASYEELVTLCDSIQKKDIIPLSFGTSDYKGGNEWWWSLAFDSTLGKGKLEKVLKGETAWNTPEVTDAMQKMLNLYQKGYINNKQSASITIDSATQLFSTGKAAMKMEGTWLLGNLTSQMKPNFDWGVFAMPSWNKNVQQELPFALGIGIAINSASKNPDAAAKFLDVWSDKDNQTKGLDYKAMGFPPVDNLDLSKLANVDPHVTEMQTIMNDFTARKATSYLSWTYWGTQTRAYTCDNIDALWLGGMDMKTFMNGMQAKADLDKAEGKLFKFK